MFNSENNKEEIGFADAYKSQILHPDDEKATSKNLIIILLLIAIIIGLSIFGYIYISKINPKENIDKNVKVIPEIKEEVNEEIEPPKSQMLNNIDELEESEPIDLKGKIPKEVKDIKIDEKPEKKEVKKKSEDTYLEQLAKLSKEIDGETKKR